MKYEGFLICTDVDGTFSITDENIRAIKEFQAEGGKFTVATGRNVNYIDEYFSPLEIKPNAPAIMCNGGVIYDYLNDKIVQENFIAPEYLEIFTKAAQDLDVEMRISQRGAKAEKETVFVPNENIDKDKMYKAVWIIREKPEAEEYIRKNFEKDFEITKSCSSLIETNKKGISKSSGTLFVKEYTKCHTLICVGDYGNDIPMLKTADISYAVENAIDEVKEAAMRVTVKNTDSAIARIIKDIENSL